MDELLKDMAEGKDLNDAELEYVKIFANLKDMEKAQNKAELKNSPCFNRAFFYFLYHGMQIYAKIAKE